MNEETKKCSKCGEVKPVNDFPKGRNTCRKCLNERHRQWVMNNSEKIKEYDHQRRLNNTEKGKERRRKYYLNNHEKEKEKCRLWYLNNPKKVKERRRKYYLNNHERIREVNYQWRLNNTEKLKENDRLRILKLTDGYIKKLLKNYGIINPEPWLIDVKRQQIALNRYFKNNNMEE